MRERDKQSTGGVLVPRVLRGEAPCRVRRTVVEESDLGGEIAAIMVHDDGMVAVAYDPSVVRGHLFALLRLWWRSRVAHGDACRILWRHELALLAD